MIPFCWILIPFYNSLRIKAEQNEREKYLTQQKSVNRPWTQLKTFFTFKSISGVTFHEIKSLFIAENLE
jgi:hypothetical protein